MADEIIDCDKERLTNGQCKMNANKLIGSESSNESKDKVVKDKVSDIFSWASFFIRTVVSVSILVSALLLIFAWWNEKWADKGKKGIKFGIIGWVVVVFSYVIIRLVQYVISG